jgi:hypothetical protein
MTQYLIIDQSCAAWDYERNQQQGKKFLYLARD